jgi:hypothetical protein
MAEIPLGGLAALCSDQALERVEPLPKLLLCDQLSELHNSAADRLGCLLDRVRHSLALDIGFGPNSTLILAHYSVPVDTRPVASVPEVRPNWTCAGLHPGSVEPRG